MIRYSLTCHNGHPFDGWFANSGAFDMQASQGLIICPTCGSAEIKKSIMAPNVSPKTRHKGREPSRGRLDVMPDGAPPPTVPEPSATALPSKVEGETRTEPVALGPMPSEQIAKLVTFMRQVRQTVEANAENVGGDFAEEARKMHYGECEERAIYGEATIDDAAELVDEGISVLPLPPLPEDQN